MTVAVHVTAGPLGDAERGEAVFGGALVVFRDVAPLRDFVALADGLIRAALGADPVRSPADPAAVADLQRRARHHPELEAAFSAVLGAAGAAVERCCWDFRRDDGSAAYDIDNTLDERRSSRHRVA